MSNQTVMIGNFRPKKYEANLVIDTAAYASGDVLSDFVAIPLAPVITGDPPIRGVVTQITLLDKDDEGGLLDLVFADAAVSLGTINDPPNISDTNAQQIVGAVSVLSYVDFGGARVARPDFEPIEFEVSDGILRVGAISRDTKTYTGASDLRVKLMIRLDNVNP